MRLAMVFGAVLACALMASGAATSEAREPVIGGPCEGCDLIFSGIPDSIPAHARIAPPGEPGEAMRIEGKVKDRDGIPVAGVIVYAYHTDAKGIYPRSEVRHGRLRGWARTDERGRYAFDTIRPAGYPGTDIPQHVHMHVIEPGRSTYWISDVMFDDDPRLTAREREAAERARGGNGIVRPRREPGGPWIVNRDIILGERIPGYR